MTHKSFNRSWITRIVQLLFVPIFILIIRFYQKRISHHKKYQCAHSHHQGGLSCSAHAIQSLENDDFIIAISKILKRRKDCHATARDHGFSYQKLYIRSGIAVVALSALTGCGGGGDDGDKNSGNNNDIEVVTNELNVDLKDNIKLLPQTVNDDIVSYSTNDDNNLILNISNSNSPLLKLDESDVVYLPPKNDSDLGVFVKIKDVTANSDGSKSVVVTQPELSEAFNSIDANIQNVETNTLSVISSYETQFLLDNNTLQSGIIEITDHKASVPISFTMRKVKEKYEGTDTYEKYESYCAYPANMIKDYQISYSESKNRAKTLCDEVFTIEGSLGFDVGKYSNTMNLEESRSGEMQVTERTGSRSSLQQKISIDGTEISANLNAKLKLEHYALSEMPRFASIYSKAVFDDYQGRALTSTFAQVAVTGLNSKDKAGKIPLVGFVFGAGGGLPVTGDITKSGIDLDDAVSLAAPAGGVAMVYMVLDASGDVSLEVDYNYNSGKKELGVTYKNNQLSAIRADKTLNTDAKNEVEFSLKADGKAVTGVAAEVDMFLTGVRLANAGMTYSSFVDGKADGKFKYDIINKKTTLDTCVAIGWGRGLQTYGNVAFGVAGKVDVGFVKGEYNTGFKYSFLYPSLKKQTDPTYSNSLWKYDLLVGSNDEEVCFDLKSPKPEIKGIQVLNTSTSTDTRPVKVNVNESTENSVYWGIKINDREEFAVELDSSGNLIDPSTNSYIELPYGNHKVTVFSHDYIDRIGSDENQVNVILDEPTLYIGFEKPTVDHTCSNVNLNANGISPSDVDKAIFTVNGKKYTANLGSSNVNGIFDYSGNINVPFTECGKNSITVTLILKNGQKVTKTEELNIFGLGETVTNVKTNPQSPGINSRFKVTVLGYNLPINTSLNLSGCNQSTLIDSLPTRHVYECTAPTAPSSNMLVIKSSNGEKVLFNSGYEVVDYSASNSNLLKTGINFCMNTLGVKVSCDNLNDMLKGLKQDGEVQTGRDMAYTTLKRNGSECIRDISTGLVWEKKVVFNLGSPYTKLNALREVGTNFNWYQSESKLSGQIRQRKCYDDMNFACDTEAYIEILNNINYCGYSDWRLPTLSELTSIVDYGRSKPAINPIFSENYNLGYAHTVWTSTEGIDGVWAVDFSRGLTLGAIYVDERDYGPTERQIRAVRSNPN